MKKYDCNSENISIQKLNDIESSNKQYIRFLTNKKYFKIKLANDYNLTNVFEKTKCFKFKKLIPIDSSNFIELSFFILFQNNWFIIEFDFEKKHRLVSLYIFKEITTYSIKAINKHGISTFYPATLPIQFSLLATYPKITINPNLETLLSAKNDSEFYFVCRSEELFNKIYNLNWTLHDPQSNLKIPSQTVFIENPKDAEESLRKFCQMRFTLERHRIADVLEKSAFNVHIKNEKNMDFLDETIFAISDILILFKQIGYSDELVEQFKKELTFMYLRRKYPTT